MIQNTFLQSTDFVTSLRNLFGGDFSGVLGLITPFIVFGIIIAAVIIVGIIVYRALMMFRAYGDAVPLGRYRLINRADRRILVGYLAKSEILENVDDLDEMAEIEELKPLANDIKKSIMDERIFLYDYNVFDWGNAVRGKAKRIRIIANTRLESDSISWRDETGNKTWRSILNKDFIRNVEAYSNSKYYEIMNPDRNYDGYYVLAVMPDVMVGKKGTVLSSLVNPESQSLIIAPTIPNNSKEIAQAASFLELIAQGNRNTKQAMLHQTKLQELLTKEQATTFALKTKISHLRRIILQQIVVGYSRQLTPMQQVNWYVWMFGAGVAGLFGNYIIPDLEVVRNTNTPPLLIGGAAVLIVILVKYMLEQKQKPLDKSDVDERPENSEMIN